MTLGSRIMYLMYHFTLVCIGHISIEVHVFIRQIRFTIWYNLGFHSLSLDAHALLLSHSKLSSFLECVHVGVWIYGQY